MREITEFNTKTNFKYLEFTLNKIIFDKICKITNRNDYGIYMFLLSIISCTLHKYEGTDYITLGVHKVDHKDELNSITTHLSKDYTYKDFLLETKKLLAEASKQQKIVNLDDSNNHKEIKVLVVYEDILYSSLFKPIVCDLSLFFKKEKDTMKLKFAYDSDCYSEEMVNKLKMNFNKLLEFVTNNPEIKLSNISLLLNEKNSLVFSLEESSYKEYSFGKPKIVTKKEFYPVSLAQERLYILHQLDQDSTLYNIPLLIEIDGEVNIHKLMCVFNKLINRHESLRTSFERVEGQVMQKIYNCIIWKIDEIITEELDKEVNSYVQPFDLTRGPLWRVGVIYETTGRQVVILDMHHIVSDGKSIELLQDEIVKLYNGEEDFTDLNLQYKDYAVKERESINSKTIQRQGEYWLKKFKGDVPLLNFPTDFPKSHIKSSEGKTMYFKVTNDITSKLKELTLMQNVKLHNVLFLSYNILLHKYSGQNNIIVGFPITRRRSQFEFRNTVGMFVNTLAIKTVIDQNKSFKDLLLQSKEEFLKDIKNSEYEFALLVDKLKITWDRGRNPLFDTTFIVDDKYNKTFKLGDKQARSSIIRYARSKKFDISLYVFYEEDEISFSIDYKTKLLKGSTIERFAKHYIKILEEISKDPEILVEKIELLSHDEKKQLLYDFNDTRIEYPKKKLIHRLFEEQVEKSPDRVAVVFNNSVLTYGQLNEKSNQLARLLEKTVAGNSIVGLMVEPSFETIIGLMAVLKAGGAYLPINHEYPAERINFLLEDAKVSALLTHKGYDKKLKFSGTVVDLGDKDLYRGDKNNLVVKNSSDDLAYLVYTSGSTGVPKGVMVTHNNLVNYTTWFLGFTKIYNEKTMLLQSYAFDLGYTSLYSSLLGGSQLHIVSRDLSLNINKLMNYVNDHEISYLKMTPSYFSAIVNSEAFVKKGLLKNISTIILGGEKINSIDIEKYQQQYPTIKFINHYGPTETTIGAVATNIDMNNLEKFKLNPVIGKPINNTRVYILNDNLELLPIGAIGELCISGDGVAKGYLNRQDLTEAKFIKNPFEEGEVLYRTGDLAKWLASGEIEFISRRDRQIKIRGFRIELEEIRNRLLSCKLIEDAVVVVVDEEKKDYNLCAYIVSNSTTVDCKVVKDYIMEYLPDYMIPNYYVFLDEIPLTYNGKVDYKGLPLPKQNTEDNYIAPTNFIEEVLVEIWQKALDLDRKIGIEENFFALGGHSLKATTIIYEIYKRLNIEVSIEELFSHLDIKKLSKHLGSKENKNYSKIEKTMIGDRYPVSPSQVRMYILNEIYKEDYNSPKILKIKGKINYGRLNLAIENLVKRHEILRTSFEVEGTGLVQKVHDYDSISIKVEVINPQNALNDSIRNFIKPFDLGKAPILRVGLINVQEDVTILILDTHHITMDAISSRIIIEEFIQLYDGKELPSIDLQYKDYAVWFEEFRDSSKFKRQEKYWLQKYKDMPTSLNLPKINLNLDQTHNIPPRNFLTLSESLTEGVKNLAVEFNTTLFIILLAAYNILLHGYTKQNDIIVGTPIAGRTNPDVQNIVGVFINTLAIRNQINPNMSVKELLKEVKQNSLESYENQDYPFDLLVDQLKVSRDSEKNPLFNTMLIFQNAPKPNLDISELQVEILQLNTNTSVFDMLFVVEEINDRIQITFHHNPECFKAEMIEKILDSFKQILFTITKDTSQLIQDIIGDISL